MIKKKERKKISEREKTLYIFSSPLLPFDHLATDEASAPSTGEWGGEPRGDITAIYHPAGQRAAGKMGATNFLEIDCKPSQANFGGRNSRTSI